MKDLAVIYLNWNGAELMPRFIPAAIRHTTGSRADLIVADNGSTDTSLQWLRENAPETKVIELGTNLGFAAGYNRAISLCRDYRYVLLLNSDVLVTKGWLAPLLDFMDANPDVGAVQPKIRSLFHPEYFEYAGAAGGYLDALGYPYCRGRLFQSIEKDEGQYDAAPADICWASGAALLCRTDLYLSLGGLDEQFFAHMEEIDLCCRIHAAGKRVCVVPDSVVFHQGGASLPAGNPKKVYLNFRNNLLLLHKNLPEKTGRRKLFIRRLCDSLAFFMFLATGKWRSAGAVLKAHRDFRTMKRNYTQFPERDMLSSLPGADRKILIDYYLKRKKS